MICLRLLGSAGLSGADGREIDSVLAQPKRFALLAYLAASDQPALHSRETLFGLFWPELSTDRARAALSQALYFLRGELGEGVLVSRGRDLVGIDHGRVDCDTVAFDRALAAGDAAAAVALYRGELLAGQFPVDSVAWEAWLDAERQRLRQAAAGAAWQCAVDAEARQERAAAMHWAGRALEWSDDDEPTFRSYLELLERHGDRAGALQAYRAYEERLRNDLGVGVAAETRRLIERIQSQADGEAGAPVVAGPPESGLVAAAIPGHGPTPAADGGGTGRRLSRNALLLLAGAGLVAAAALWLAAVRDSAEFAEFADGAGEPAATSAPGTLEPDARALYLRGRHLLSRGGAEALSTARTHFEDALELDPEFGAAWSGLADAYLRLGTSHALPRESAYPRAREAAERALALDPDLSEAHASLAAVLTSYYWDSAAAERHFRRALELEPENAETLSRYSSHLRNHGRFAEARAAAERAVAIDPLAFSSHFDTVVLDLMEGHYDRAERNLRNLIAVDPGNRMAHFMLARVLAQAGDNEAALDILDGMKGAPPLPVLTLRGYVLGRTGQEAEARDVLAQLAGLDAGGVAFDEAVVLLGLGDRAGSLDALERALEQRDHRVRLLREEPMFTPLRDDPRFAVLLERAGLGQ